MLALGRGGLQFMLIIWLQGIWLPLHGYSFEPDPAVGRHLPGPADHRLPGLRAAVGRAVRPVWAPRRFTTGGVLLTALSFVLLELLPVDFTYWAFALLLLLNGVGFGLFSSPNRAEMMNSVPANAARRRQRA